MGYLVHVHCTRTYEVKLKDVLMVRDFLNVFLDELPRLPSKREMEVAIILVLRIHPISLHSYRMTLVELKE